jgi:hypothetical protein
MIHYSRNIKTSFLLHLLKEVIKTNKSQGLIGEKGTINIGKQERQGMTFTAISRVKYLNGLHISTSLYIIFMPKGVHLLTMGTFNRFLVLNQFCMDKIKF